MRDCARVFAVLGVWPAGSEARTMRRQGQFWSAGRSRRETALREAAAQACAATAAGTRVWVKRSSTASGAVSKTTRGRPQTRAATRSCDDPRIGTPALPAGRHAVLLPRWPWMAPRRSTASCRTAEEEQSAGAAAQRRPGWPKRSRDSRRRHIRREHIGSVVTFWAVRRYGLGKVRRWNFGCYARLGGFPAEGFWPITALLPGFPHEILARFVQVSRLLRRSFWPFCSAEKFCWNQGAESGEDLLWCGVACEQSLFDEVVFDGLDFLVLAN